MCIRDRAWISSAPAAGIPAVEFDWSTSTHKSVSYTHLSFQPSEIVKLAFILGGATTLDRMFTRRNLIFTLLFSAFCVGCLGLMSDFGTALLFFATFLAIAFLRSGDLPSVSFMGAAAVFGGYIICLLYTSLCR